MAHRRCIKRQQQCQNGWKVSIKRDSRFFFKLWKSLSLPWSSTVSWFHFSDYFAWHSETLRHLEHLAQENDYDSSNIVAKILERNSNYFDSASWATNVTTQQNESPPPHPIQFLILRCNVKDRCGGFADRIKPLPVFLAAAANSRAESSGTPSLYVIYANICPAIIWALLWL